MITKKISRTTAIVAASTLLSLATLQSAYAAPGTLATAPLFLSTIVEPNIYFTVDDSGSMDWNPILATGTGGLPTFEGLPYIDGQQRAYYSPTFTRLYSGRLTLPPSNGAYPEWDLGWMVRNHNANLNYYNPTVKYQPWPGTNADGTPMFKDADPTNALKDPFNPGGEKMDLTAKYTFTEGTKTGTLYLPTYYTWTDTDGNGVIDQTDAHTEVQIAAGTPEMQNFANWFQYYRSRIGAAKSILGSTINNTTAARMGMHQFNDGQLAAVASMTDPANKRNLLQPFYNYDVKAQGTPMRLSLEDVGAYFDDQGTNAPILPKSEGGECQQNFNILIGDGFWNGKDPNLGNTDIDANNDNSVFDGDASQSIDGGNYADKYRNTLADVAMDNYERDLRNDLADRVPTTPGLDLATHQHLVTYTISFGPIGTLDPAVDNPLSIGFEWPDPSKGDAEKIDDMWHAAYNGRGKFLSADDPATLARALNTAIEDIAQRTATAAAVSINSAKLTTESVVYLAQFNTNRWQGNLIAFKILDLSTGKLAGTPQWTAADQLNARNIVTRPRTIITHDGSKGVPFQWDSLSMTQQFDLMTDPQGNPNSETVARARLAYLRGDRSNEGTGFFFRERASLLADLVNSGPVFVGKPALNWPDKAPFPTAVGERYSDFKNGPAASREGVVYVGSNGGMMHGFAESDGEEVLAYIANNLFSYSAGEGLHYLTEPNYAHRYYNDLTPTVSDIYADLGYGTKWQSVLISGERGGGRGIYALNITDPSFFSESRADKIALWELSSADDPDLGYTYSRPQIGLTNNGKWVAIFGNGYNDLGSGEAQLFIVDIAGGADGSWDSGDIIKISTGTGTAADRNGLATPALADLDGNGTIDRVYAGDLHGNMWAFDLSGNGAGSWGVAGGAPLFTTINNEPITSKPAIAKHPTQSDNTSNAPNVMVYFGSGQYLVSADKTTNNLNHFYGVWDRGSNNVTDASLVEQTYESNFTDATGLPVRVLTRNPVDYAGGDMGWYFELDISGERSVTNPVVRGDVVFFNSFVPVDDPCSVGGFGYRFAVDVETGGSPLKAAVDANNDGLINDADRASNGIDTATIAAVMQEGYLPEPVFIEDIAFTADTPSKVVKLKHIPKGRFSWQELIQ